VKAEEEEEDKEVYSDPEEDGVEIIDMNLVKDMDWSAPDILKRSTKKSSKVKKEAKEGKLKDAKGEDAQIDLANALDLSESEEEEETEDLHDFLPVGKMRWIRTDNKHGSYISFNSPRRFLLSSLKSSLRM